MGAVELLVDVAGVVERHGVAARGVALAFVEEQQRTWLPLLEKIPVK